MSHLARNGPTRGHSGRDPVCGPIMLSRRIRLVRGSCVFHRSHFNQYRLFNIAQSGLLRLGIVWLYRTFVNGGIPLPTNSEEHWDMAVSSELGIQNKSQRSVAAEMPADRKSVV